MDCLVFCSEVLCVFKCAVLPVNLDRTMFTRESFF